MKISDKDEAFLRKWFEGIATKNEFDKKYKDFMGVEPCDEPQLGSNRRILNDFIDAKKHQALAAYALSLYSHTVAGRRASLAFRVTKITVVLSITIAGFTLGISGAELFGGILFVFGAGLFAYLMQKLWRKDMR